MDDEQFERHKEFMLQQQAQSAVRIAQLEELLVRFAQATRDRFEVVDRRAGETDRKLAALIDFQERAENRVADKIAALVDAQIQTEDRVAEIDKRAQESGAEIERRARESAADFDRRMAMLADSQRKTEEIVRKVGERIDNLAAVVERHIVEGHNGRSET